MSAEKKKQMGVLGLVIALVVVLMSGLLFVGAVAGWFDDSKVVLSEEYRCSDDCSELTELSASEYGELIQARKSFVVFIDQSDCKSADKLEEYVRGWASGAGVRVYRMMFADMKDTALHESVKYYPSVAIVDEGRVRVWMKADSSEDADAYNSYDDFVKWVSKYI